VKMKTISMMSAKIAACMSVCVKFAEIAVCMSANVLTFVNNQWLQQLCHIRLLNIALLRHLIQFLNITLLRHLIQFLNITLLRHLIRLHNIVRRHLTNRSRLHIANYLPLHITRALLHHNMHRGTHHNLHHNTHHNMHHNMHRDTLPNLNAKCASLRIHLMAAPTNAVVINMQLAMLIACLVGSNELAPMETAPISTTWPRLYSLIFLR